VPNSSGVDDAVVGTEKDRENSSSNRRSISPNDSQYVESDVEASLYRHDRSAERSTTSKSRRSLSLDDVRDENADVNAATSDKMYGDDVSVNGNGDNNGNLTTDSEDADTRFGISGTDDGRMDAGTSDSQGVRIIPVVRARSFKEAMRGQLESQQMDYSRALSHPAHPAAAMESGQDSRSGQAESSRDSARSSWVMPSFPSLEEVFNEWFTSAMARTGSRGSSSSTPRVRPLSEISTSSTPVEGQGVHMRFPSRNSMAGEISPLNMPEFHNKRLSRVFDWEPTTLGSISGSSDSLDSADVANDQKDSGTGLSADRQLPPGFETGLFDRGFGFRPSLLSSVLPSLSDPHISGLHFPLDVTRGSAVASKVSEASGAVRHPQSGSTSRMVPIKVITSQSSAGGEVADTACGPSGGGSAAAANRRVKAAITKSNSSSLVEGESKPALDSKHRTLPLSKRSSHSSQLPAGFLTKLDPVSIPKTSGKSSKQTSESSKVDSRNVKVVSVSEANNERTVRVIPISHKQSVETCEAPTRKQRSNRGRVIPVVVQSSASVRESNVLNMNDAPNSSCLTSSQRSETGAVSIPVTVLQSDSGEAAKSSAMSDRNFLPLCYDDEAGESVKNILREMTIRRLPIRDTVRLLNTRATRSRSMDFLDSKRHGVCEESPSGGGDRHMSVKRNASIASPTVELLPPGFMVQNEANQSASQLSETNVPPVTGDLIRKRLHQFDGADANSA